MQASAPKIFLIACDVSADQNAARLALAIRQRAPNARLLGIGGSHQQQAGVELLLETTHLSFTGVLGALGRLPSVVRAYRRARQLVLEHRPDLVVIVDGEILACPFAAQLRRHGIPVVLFFPPHVWFWGAWRAPLIASIPARVLSAFREEAQIYANAGTDTVWIGHPLRDIVTTNGDGAATLAQLGIDRSRRLVALMPGSRDNEIARLLGPFLGAARLLQDRDPSLQFVLPVASDRLYANIENRARSVKLDNLILYRPTSYDVLAAADVIIQSSGTATLETALLGIPSVIAYRCLTIEYLAARLMMRVRFIGLPNILLGERVQPEFFQHGVDAANLADEAWSLLTDERRRTAIRGRLAQLPGLLGPPGVLQRAADAILDLVATPLRRGRLSK